MRALAPLPAFLLLAASAAACPFGYPGHVHPSAAQAAAGTSHLPSGPCDGTFPATKVPRGGKPWDLRAHPLAAADRPFWEDAGFRIDTQRAHVIDSEGTDLSEEGMSFLLAPWDAANERLSLNMWNGLMMGGYRLDEASCRVDGPDSKPITRLAILYHKASMAKGLTSFALERLLAVLRDLPPGKPVPERVHQMAREMASAGAPLPPEVLAVLSRPNATVAALRGPATASYEGLRRYFDGQTPLADYLGLAVPASGGAAARRAPYRDSAEREFGRVLQAGFVAELSRNPVGADLLARFARDKRNGMPNVLILKLTQRPQDSTQAAVYDPGADSIIINHWVVAEAVRKNTPREKRAQVDPLLSDPAKLMAYLSRDPALFKTVIGEIDIEYFHEFLHADQSRRTRIDDEAVRGNTPGANPLDKEREAHREHCRYLFSKASYDPAAVTSSRWRPYCTGMLRDPDAFQDEVTRNYLSSFAGSVRDSELLRMQEVRRAALDAPGGDWRQTARQVLRKIGLHYGDAAIAEFDRDVSARNKEFNEHIGSFRDKAVAQMAASERGRPELALQYLAIDPKWKSSPAGANAVEFAMRSITAGPADPDALNDRIAAENLVIDWLVAKGMPTPEEFGKARARDYRVVAETYLRLAKAATGPQRDSAFATAEGFALAVPDLPLAAKIRAARLKK